MRTRLSPKLLYRKLNYLYNGIKLVDIRYDDELNTGHLKKVSHNHHTLAAQIFALGLHEQPEHHAQILNVRGEHLPVHRVVLDHFVIELCGIGEENLHKGISRYCACKKTKEKYIWGYHWCIEY